jgi:membrane protein YqaA with SNARE-associated domain
MDLQSIEPFFRDQGPLTGTFLVGFLSGFIPLINLEIFLLGMISILHLSDMLWMIALAAAAGQMLAKMILYYASAGVIKITKKKGKRFDPKKIEKISEKLLKGGWKGDSVMLASALFGLPPIYLTALVAGIARYPIVKFLILGLIGRFFRFFAVVYFPEGLAKIRSYF